MDNNQEIIIDFNFNTEKPSFGDLFKIAGFENPDFPSNNNRFLNLKYLGIEQVDDYFGIRNNSGKGADVILWLFPLVKDEEVFHHHGPYDGLRLRYDILRNSIDKVQTVENVFTAFANQLETTISFDNEPIDNFSSVKSGIDLKIKYWHDKGIEPGSDEALMQDDDADE